MSDKRVVVVGAPGTCMLLTILLAVLKATGHIDIGWLWVFSPLWLPWACLLGVLAGGCLLVGVLFAAAEAHDRIKTYMLVKRFSKR